MHDGAPAEAADRRKSEKCGGAGAGTFTLVSLSHETNGRVGPAAFAFLNRLAAVSAGSGAMSQRRFLENAMRDISTTLCRAVMWQVQAAAPLMARHASKAVLAGHAVTSENLAAHRPSGLSRPSGFPPVSRRRPMASGSSTPGIAWHAR